MIDSLFLRLLHPVPIDRPVHIHPGELEESKALAADHNLLLLVCKRLKELGQKTDGDINDFLEENRSLSYINVARTSRQQELASHALSLLKTQGIPGLLLRGSECSSEFYGDPFCRVSADIDILIREADVFTADELLSQAGFLHADDLPLRFLLSRIHHAVYRAPDSGDLIELHWNFGVPSYFNLDSESIWKEVKSEEGKPHRLSPEMTVIQLLIHHHMHSFRELRILVDILWCFYRYEKQIDWANVCSMVEKVGLVKTTLVTLSQMRDVWNSNPPLPAEERLADELMRKGYTPPEFLLSFFRLNVGKRHPFQNPKDKAMARMALDDWKTILYSFSKTFFPSPSAIRGLYGDTRSWTLPAHYMRFIFWRVRKAW